MVLLAANTNMLVLMSGPVVYHFMIAKCLYNFLIAKLHKSYISTQIF